MSCKLIVEEDFSAIQCGCIDCVLPMDSEFSLEQEPESGIVNILMNRMSVNETWLKKSVTLKEIEKLAQGWPGQAFYIELTTMSLELKYQRKGPNKWVLIKSGPGIAAH